MNIFHQIFQCLQPYHLSIQNKHDVYSGKECMKVFCESLQEHAIKTINLRKNEVINKGETGII